MLVVFNKIDLVDDPAVLAGLRRHFPDALFVSVQTGEGICGLIDTIGEWVENGAVTRELRLPLTSGALLARLHREGRVHEVEHLGDETRVVATLSCRLREALAEFVCDPPEENPARAPQSARDKVAAAS